MICAALRRGGVMDDTRGGRHRPFVVFGAFVSAIQYYVKYHRGPLRLTTHSHRHGSTSTSTTTREREGHSMEGGVRG